ncbi:MAG: Uma2 family endonuclease [Myxococcota bacterium]|nr:Uma2 family endonuclease [Myxococcota bacterium]
MAAAPARRRATYPELAALPDNVVGEIINGDLHASPRPASLHSRATTELSAELTLPFGRGRGGPGGWVILVEPELHLGEDVLVPDLAAWRRERMPELPETPAFTLAPDWVCEVLSPSTAAFDRSQKMPVYGAAGVSHAWLVDPVIKTLEVYRLAQPGWVLVGAFTAPRVRAEPFEAVELELQTLWAR